MLHMRLCGQRVSMWGTCAAVQFPVFWLKKETLLHGVTIYIAIKHYQLIYKSECSKCWNCSSISSVISEIFGFGFADRDRPAAAIYSSVTRTVADDRYGSKRTKGTESLWLDSFQGREAHRILEYWKIKLQNTDVETAVVSLHKRSCHICLNQISND